MNIFMLLVRLNFKQHILFILETSQNLCWQLAHWIRRACSEKHIHIHFTKLEVLVSCTRFGTWWSWSGLSCIRVHIGLKSLTLRTRLVGDCLTFPPPTSAQTFKLLILILIQKFQTETWNYENMFNNWKWGYLCFAKWRYTMNYGAKPKITHYTIIIATLSKCMFQFPLRFSSNKHVKWLPLHIILTYIMYVILHPLNCELQPPHSMESGIEEIFESGEESIRNLMGMYGIVLGLDWWRLIRCGCRCRRLAMQWAKGGVELSDNRNDIYTQFDQPSEPINSQPNHPRKPYSTLPYTIIPFIHLQDEYSHCLPRRRWRRKENIIYTSSGTSDFK